MISGLIVLGVWLGYIILIGAIVGWNWNKHNG